MDVKTLANLQLTLNEVETVKEASQLSGVSMRQIFRLVAEGKLSRKPKNTNRQPVRISTVALYPEEWERLNQLCKKYNASQGRVLANLIDKYFATEFLTYR